MPNTLHSVCVPLRQCLVMSVLYGDSHEQTYFCNVHKTERATLGQMEGCQPLGGSTRCGHLTGRLANHLSGTRVYKSHGRPDLGVCVL